MKSNHSKKKIVHIVGARPQFVKLAPLHNALADYSDVIDQSIIHTGQHYDEAMSDRFFEELKIPNPDVNCSISGGGHGEQTGRMLIALEPIMQQYEPSLVIVYGDTNSTLAGAICAAKCHIPILHIEAGLRSFDRKMPEEQNRILTDSISSYLMCPTGLAVENLKQEGIVDGVFESGDLMMDTLKDVSEYVKKTNHINNIKKKYSDFDFTKNFNFLTLHRPSNVDSKYMLRSIFEVVEASDYPVFFRFILVHENSLSYFRLSLLIEFIVLIH